MSIAKFAKQGLGKERIRKTLEDHLEGTSHVRKIEPTLAEVHTKDAVFGPRTALLVEIAESLDVTVFDIFDDEYFRVINYFQGRPEDQRSNCDYCFEHNLATGYSMEFGDKPENIQQFDIGEQCLSEITRVFARNKSAVKKQMEEAKKGAFAAKHKEIGEAVSRYFQGKVTIDDLSLAMMEKLVRMRARYESEAREFGEYLAGQAKTQDEIRTQFRNKYRAQLGKAVAYLNSLPVSDLVRSLQTEIGEAKRKAHLMGRVLDLENLPEGDRAIVEQVFYSTEPISAQQFGRINAIFRMWYPRNLGNSYGSLIKDVARRHREGAISDEVYARIRHLVEQPGRLATGEECMMLRWADPDDILKVRQETNKATFKHYVQEYGINPFTALRQKLLDHYEADATAYAAKSTQRALLTEDYHLIKGLMDLTGSIAHANIRTNPSRFRTTVTQALAMDDFEDTVERLSVLARKNRYQMETGRDDVLRTRYISTDRFLDEAGLDDIKIGEYVAKLGIQIGNKSRRELSQEVAQGIIDRVANTYYDDHHFCKWQAENRQDLLRAEGLNFHLIRGDKKFLRALLTQYDKVKDASPLGEETVHALQQAGRAGLIANIKGIRASVSPYASKLMYKA